MKNIKDETVRRLRKRLNISESTTLSLFEEGLIDDRTAKRFLIRDEFESASPQKGEVGEVKERIAEQYCVSFETASNYIAGRYK